MRKEIIFAIFVGIIFGGIFAFGIRRANVALKPSDNIPTTDQQIQQEPPEEEISTDGVTISSPENNDVFTENEIAIIGITRPESTVIISAEDEDFAIVSDSSGEFQQDIELTGGLNNILIKVFDGKNTIGSEELNLVYTTEIDL